MCSSHEKQDILVIFLAPRKFKKNGERERGNHSAIVAELEVPKIMVKKLFSPSLCTNWKVLVSVEWLLELAKHSFLQTHPWLWEKVEEEGKAQSQFSCVVDELHMLWNVEMKEVHKNMV